MCHFEQVIHEDDFLVVHHVSRRRYLYTSSKHDIVVFWILIRYLLSVVNSTLSSKWGIDFRGPLVPFFFISSLVEDLTCCPGRLSALSTHLKPIFSSPYKIPNFFFGLFQVFRWVTMKMVKLDCCPTNHNDVSKYTEKIQSWCRLVGSTGV